MHWYARLNFKNVKHFELKLSSGLPSDCSANCSCLLHDFQFLGDALINFIATCRIFCADATLTPREIHVRKHFIGSTDAQARFKI